MRKKLILAVVCLLLFGICARAEETSTVFVAFGCAPGYTGGAEVTLLNEEGQEYIVTVSGDNGWCCDVQVAPGTYTAKAEVVGGDDGDICIIDENRKTLAPGQTDSFAGVVGNEWDVMERATIIQLDAVGEDGRQTIYGELEEEDIYAFFDQQKQASEGRKQASRQEKEEEGVVEPDETETTVTVHDSDDAAEEKEEKEKTGVQVPVWIFFAAAIVLLAAAVLLVRKKRNEK